MTLDGNILEVDVQYVNVSETLGLLVILKVNFDVLLWQFVGQVGSTLDQTCTPWP